MTKATGTVVRERAAPVGRDAKAQAADVLVVFVHAAMMGTSSRFERQDVVEEKWRIMQPLLDAPAPVHAYAPGSWGPHAAAKLVAGHGRWHEPWVQA